MHICKYICYYVFMLRWVLKILSLLLILLGSACTHFKETELVREVEELVKSDPQKALSILDSVKFFPYLSPKYKHRAKFISIYAKYKLKRDISFVQGLDKLARAFESEGDWYRASWTNFLNAKIKQQKSDFEETGIYLSKAREVAQNRNDSNLLINIYCTMAELYLTQQDKQSAITYYKQALNYHNIRGEKGLVAYLIGNCYLNLGDYSAAMKYYKKAECEFINENNSGETVRLLLNIGNSYNQISDRSKALVYIRKALKHTSDDDLRNKCYLSLADTYLSLNEDSVLCYLHKVPVKLSDDFELKREYYRIAYQLEVSQNDFQHALQSYMLYSGYIDSLQLQFAEQRMDHVIARYEQRKLSRKNSRLIREKIILWIGVSFLFLMIVTGVLYVRNIMRKRQLEYAEACCLIETLQRLAKEQDACQDEVRKLLLEKLEVTKKLTLLSLQPIGKHKSFLEMYHKLIDGKAESLDWSEIYFTINFLYDHFQENLVRYFPEFTEKEIQLCCLLKAGFKSDEIAYIFHVSVYSIQKWKTAIRKKEGLDERADILDYILMTLEKEK